jgi:hypothetical protein
MLEEVREVVGVKMSADAGEDAKLRGRFQDAHKRINALEGKNGRLREAAEQGGGVTGEYS